MDPLTESLNRHAFYSLLEKHHDRTETRIEGCAALIDVDHLKGINDSLGHHAGDAAIRAVANAIRAQIRADDLLFRWGGDEFLFLLFGVSRTEGRARMARLNDALRDTILPGSVKPVAVTVSYGLVAFDASTPLELVIERADAEMYSVKQRSRRHAV
jgi:diguanylate cyclase (GGDEF)-like protein